MTDTFEDFVEVVVQEVILAELILACLEEEVSRDKTRVLS